MNKKIRTDAVDHLFGAVLELKDKEECYKFFEDLCTVNELLSLSQRFTISRVNRSLNYGNDGYDMVLDRMENENTDKQA